MFWSRSRRRRSRGQKIFLYDNDKLSHGASAFLRTIIRGYALRHGTKAPWLLAR